MYSLLLSITMEFCKMFFLVAVVVRINTKNQLEMMDQLSL